MVDHLEQDQLQSYKEAFDSFDWNHNGKVSSTQLQVDCLLDQIQLIFQIFDACKISGLNESRETDRDITLNG